MLMATAMMTAGFSLLLYLHVIDIIRYKKQIFRHHAETMADNINYEIRNKEILQDYVALQSFVEETKNKNPEIDRINIYGLYEGKYLVIASSSLPLIGLEADPDDILPIKTQKINIIEKKVNNTPFLEVQGPLYENGLPVASVGLYLNLRLAKKEIYAHISDHLLIGLLVFMSSLLAIYLYFRLYLTRPLLSLQQAIQQMSKGNLNTVVPIHRQDELGEISEAFNRMAQELSTAQRRLLELERTRVAAQIAGTAAHELNQPLTAISIHCELLLRSLPEGDPHREQLNTVLAEAERMAKIIKMMTGITGYKTQPYLGETEIIDLEKASKKPQDKSGV